LLAAFAGTRIVVSRDRVRRRRTRRADLGRAQPHAVELPTDPVVRRRFRVLASTDNQEVMAGLKAFLRLARSELS
jgi:hypothetical protein